MCRALGFLTPQKCKMHIMYVQARPSITHGLPSKLVISMCLPYPVPRLLRGNLMSNNGGTVSTIIGYGSFLLAVKGSTTEPHFPEFPSSTQPKANLTRKQDFLKSTLPSLGCEFGSEEKHINVKEAINNPR